SPSGATARGRRRGVFPIAPEHAGPAGDLVGRKDRRAAPAPPPRNDARPGAAGARPVPEGEAAAESAPCDRLVAALVAGEAVPRPARRPRAVHRDAEVAAVHPRRPPVA